MKYTFKSDKSFWTFVRKKFQPSSSRPPQNFTELKTFNGNRFNKSAINKDIKRRRGEKNDTEYMSFFTLKQEAGVKKNETIQQNPVV